MHPVYVERDGQFILFYSYFNGVKREIYYLAIQKNDDIDALHERLREKRWYTPQVEAAVDTFAEQILL